MEILHNYYKPFDRKFSSLSLYLLPFSKTIFSRQNFCFFMFLTKLLFSLTKLMIFFVFDGNPYDFDRLLLYVFDKKKSFLWQNLCFTALVFFVTGYRFCNGVSNLCNRVSVFVTVLVTSVTMLVNIYLNKKGI